MDEFNEEFKNEITGVISPSETSLKLSRTYRFVRKLGEGGMGEVFLAKTFVFGKDKLVAIKILNKNKLPTPDALERFYREAENLDKAKHENIVGFVEFWENENLAYLVMEYLPGIDLEAYVEHNGAFPRETAIFIIIQILKALAYMFEKHGMFHRDIKPSNIQLLKGSSNEAALMDFGNAKIVGDSDSVEEDKSLTMISNIMSGTPGYVPPEVGMDNFEQEDDVFAIAATLLYCLFGHNPFLVLDDPNGDPIAASRMKIYNHQLDLEDYEGTMLGHWLHINTNPERKNRMTLVQAYRSLEKILKNQDDFLKPVSKEMVRFLGSDQAFMEFINQGGIEINENKELGIANNKTLSIASLGMTNPNFRLSDLEERTPSPEEEEESDKLRKEKISNQLNLIDKRIAVDKGIIAVNKKQRRKKLLISALVLFIVLALIAGFAYKTFFNKKDNKQSNLVEETLPEKLENEKKIKKKLALKRIPKKAAINIKNLKRFKNIQKIYKLVRNSKKRMKILNDADLFYKYSEFKNDKKAELQAEWRWLAIYRKANLKDLDKAKVVRKLFNLYCYLQSKKKIANLWGRRHGKIGNTKLICR